MDWRPWMDAFLPPLLEALPGRVAFVGIQGSFGRGEAGPESDVDLVVVLDALGAAELAACRGVLEKMPFADRACGFFCDRAALAAWPAFDALQLRLDTLPGLRLSGGTAAPPWGRRRWTRPFGRRPPPSTMPPATPPSLTPSRRRPSPPSKRRPSLPCGWPTAGGAANIRPPASPCSPSWSRRSGPCWGRIAPCPPSWRGPGRDGILTQALPGMQQTPAPNRRGVCDS